jgi:hypothetical protein
MHVMTALSLRTAFSLEQIMPEREYEQPITVAAQSKAWTVFARSNAEIVRSNPNQGMNVCVLLCR